MIDSGQEEEKTTIYRAKFHWAVLLGPILVVILGGLALKTQGYHVMVLIAFGLGWGLFSYMSLSKSELRLTRKRVFINPGLPWKRSYDIPLDKIAVVDFYQPSLGSILDFGKIIIIHDRNVRSVVRFVSSPGEVVREMQKQIIALESTPTKP